MFSFIGKFKNDANFNYFNGQVCDVRLWNYARSQSEIVAYEKTVQDPANNNFLTEKQNKEYLAMQGYIFWLSKLWAGDDQVLYNWSHA